MIGVSGSMLITYCHRWVACAVSRHSILGSFGTPRFYQNRKAEDPEVLIPGFNTTPSSSTNWGTIGNLIWRRHSARRISRPTARCRGSRTTAIIRQDQLFRGRHHCSPDIRTQCRRHAAETDRKVDGQPFRSHACHRCNAPIAPSTAGRHRSPSEGLRHASTVVPFRGW